ncbi:phosphopentomutase [Gelria sp. Kuro-4]|uniref:phosphopentomutase n=1 Tax=Gelria sp. Kuro-4 TaxID=2796927 RepID=UPI001C8185E6|nr:phosphopentomutase [Gelria sp. Kuro-4]
MLRRVVVVVADSAGAGALPDAGAYGDEASNTLGHVAQAAGGLKLPLLQRLGLGNILPLQGVPPAREPLAAFGRLAEQSAGKDTTTGHWELMGIILPRPFPVYPQGFPPALIARFEKAIGRRTLGNKPASGTAIIEELGAEHLATGWPIVYTSADSVFQVAAHEEVIPPEELYHICAVARRLLTGADAVARVIARPFVGRPGSFRRTADRRDFSLPPPAPTVLDQALAAGRRVLGVGKIGDIFAGRGLTECRHTAGNAAGLAATRAALEEGTWDLVFTNLVDFDMLYGHRNDAAGYARALEEMDRGLGRVLAALGQEDVFFLTADHGCDPTTPSTDHSREYVPLLAYGRTVRAVSLGTRTTFADLGATVADILGLAWEGPGTSFWPALQ